MTKSAIVLCACLLMAACAPGAEPGNGSQSTAHEGAVFSSYVSGAPAHRAHAPGAHDSGAHDSTGPHMLPNGIYWEPYYD